MSAVSSLLGDHCGLLIPVAILLLKCLIAGIPGK